MPTLLLLYSLANFVLILNGDLVNSDGLTLQLIHPDSPESPYFQSNISDEERIRRSVLSQAANTCTRTVSSSLIVRPQVEVQLFRYVVKIGIGTFKTKPPYKEYYLEMDTGSSLIWLQCEGCTKCFKQTPKPFPKDKSSTFRPILLSGNKPASYHIAYADGDRSQGILARESFHFKSTTGVVMTKIENVKFGCGLYNEMKNYNYRTNKIAGIMGLGWADLSVVNQFHRQSKGKFSYCLPPISGKNSVPKTYLRFGDDVMQPKNAESTPLFKVGNDHSPYHVELKGISLNQRKLNIDPKVFALKANDSTSGCIIDTGFTYSRIIGPAFNILKVEMEKYFSRFKNLKKLIRNDLSLELCYERNKPEGFRNLPDVTFHLRGADFVMKAEAVFEVFRTWVLPFKKKEYFCLVIVRSSTRSVIGAHQQTNQMIVYDTLNKVLAFAQVDCSKYP